MVPENILSQPSAARLHHRAHSKHGDQGDCPGWTQHPQLQVFAFLWPWASLCLGQAPGSHNDTHYLPHLANICCVLLVKIRGKLVLFPLKRLFYVISSFRALAFVLRIVEFKLLYKAQSRESRCFVLGLVLYRTKCWGEPSPKSFHKCHKIPHVVVLHVQLTGTLSHQTLSHLMKCLLGIVRTANTQKDFQ